MKYIPRLLVSLIVASCSFSSDFYFDEDFSGKVENRIDVSTLIAFAGEDSDSLELGIREGISEKRDSIIDIFDRKKGISNTDIYYTEAVITFEYDFNDIESLNGVGTSLNNVDDNLQGFMLSAGQFSADNEQFSFVESPTDDTEMLQDTSFTQMLEFMELTNSFHFKNPIMTTTNGAYVLSEDNRSVSMTKKGQEITNAKVSFGTQINFK